MESSWNLDYKYCQTGTCDSHKDMNNIPPTCMLRCWYTVHNKSLATTVQIYKYFGSQTFHFVFVIVAVMQALFELGTLFCLSAHNNILHWHAAVWYGPQLWNTDPILYTELGVSTQENELQQPVLQAKVSSNRFTAPHYNRLASIKSKVSLHFLLQQVQKSSKGLVRNVTNT